MRQAWRSLYEAHDAAAILAALPPTAQGSSKAAGQEFRELLKSGPHHPSLHFKKVGKTKQLWSVRVGSNYRALGTEKPDGILWFWIGPHSTV
jgi:hypothetical protein